MKEAYNNFIMHLFKLLFYKKKSWQDCVYDYFILFFFKVLVYNLASVSYCLLEVQMNSTLKKCIYYFLIIKNYLESKNYL